MDRYQAITTEGKDLEKSSGDETWFTATGEEDGNLLLFRGRLQLPPEVIESDYPYRMDIYWPYNPAINEGMPDKETNTAQVALEDALTILDTTDISLLMLVVTGNGRKAWHWYVSDTRVWMRDFNTLLRDHLEYPIMIENIFEPDWRLYHDFISGLTGN